MATRHVTPPWDYLREASSSSLESFELSRLNHAANLRKEIAALLDQWIEEAAEALLARWLRENHRSRQEPSQPLDILPEICGPTVTVPPAEPIAVRPGQHEHAIRPPRRSAAAR